MFEQVVEYVARARANNESVAIFLPSQKISGLFGEVLVSQSEIDASWLGDTVQIVDSESIRNIPPMDSLIFLGAQRPSFKSFYIHPRVEGIQVFTHTDWAAAMVERHAGEAIEKLRETFGLDDTSVPDLRLEADYDVSCTHEINEYNQNTRFIPPNPMNSTETDGIDDTAATRIRAIVEIAPTSNGELAEKWGFGSGSEVYEYLSSELNQYYTRNEEKYIVPTDEAKRLVEDSDL
jgi:hypothetical protein